MLVVKSAAFAVLDKVCYRTLTQEAAYSSQAHERQRDADLV
jgi:hypothetical protein